MGWRSFDERNPPNGLSADCDELERELEVLAIDIQTTSIEAMVKIGESLNRAKELFAEGAESRFGTWCEARLSMTARRARDLISVYEFIGHDGARALRGHSRRAVIDLAAPSMPATVREAVILDASRGVVHTAASIRILRKDAEERAQRQLALQRFKLGFSLPSSSEVIVIHNGPSYSHDKIAVDNRTNIFIFESELRADWFEIIWHDSRARQSQTISFEAYHRGQEEDIIDFAWLILGRTREPITVFPKLLTAELRAECRKICDLWRA